MRREQSNGGGASLSFLDIIACAFGAIVLLVLILPVGEPEGGAQETGAGLDEYGALLVLQAELDELILELTDDLAQADARLANLDNLLKSERLDADSLQQLVRGTQEKIRTVQGQIAGVSSQESIAPIPAPSEYAGIPVDSEYVAVVVDTSGSMQDIWRTVAKQINNLLSIYPKIKGFQILNAEGTYMRSRGRWIRDSPSLRRLAMRKLATWKPFSPSNPEKGIKVALRDLYEPNMKMAIVVFGDDYQGTDYENFLTTIRTTVARYAHLGGELRIHAFGFPNFPVGLEQQTKYAILMRALTQEHQGAFLAL